MKRITAMIISACMAATMISGISFAQEATLEDASSYTGSVENATIDATIYLDYSAGIEAGVYKWILSDDGSYYTLAQVDESGDAATKEEAQINVGANNEERETESTGTEGESAGEEVESAGEEGELAGGEDKSNGESADEEGELAGGEGESNGESTGEEGESAGGEGKSEGGPGGPGGPGGSGGGSVYEGVYMNANITNEDYQTMLIYVPAAYMTVDGDGNVTGIDHEAVVGNYTADTAPIIFSNECGGWMSSSPRSADTACLEEGIIYVAAGARSRGAQDENGVPSGKAPTPVVDLKSGVIALRANQDIIPGDTGRIISIGTSGGGQMSSILGASGNMPEYYEYLYEAGAIGVTKNEDGTFSSAYPDNIYAAQCYCPIADIENADLAYAWWWVDLADVGGTYNGSMTDFERRLQELEAEAFVEYLNSLGLTDETGNALTLTGLRSGSYYEAILTNLSDALNAMVESGGIDPETKYPDHESWLTQGEDGSWQVIDLAGFMVGTGLVNNRNKPVPGFDTMDKSAENNAFGTTEETAVHYSRSVAQILSDNYEELSALDGFDQEQVDCYIEEALTGEEADSVRSQTGLMNATQILLGYGEYEAVDPAQYWRVRSGTADQHTSFSIGYNICLTAAMLGYETDYHLVWNMAHGSNEGSSTGTFIDWVNEICAAR